MTTTTAAHPATATAERYLVPDWFTRNVVNRLVRRLTRMGVSVRGSRELRHLGRTSGAWHSIPVNLLTVDGEDYLVAPRGTTQWVRNVRAAGGGELRLGRTSLGASLRAHVMGHFDHDAAWGAHDHAAALTSDGADLTVSPEIAAQGQFYVAYRL